MNILVRPVNLETDLEALARLISQADQTPSTPGDIRRLLTHLPPGRVTCRLAAVDDRDRLVGYACAVHENWWEPAGVFYAWVGTDLEHRRQGIGKALGAALWEFLKGQKACELWTDVWDDDPVSLAFGRKYGFEIDRHLFKSSLDLASFDETPFSGVIGTLEGEGLRFTSLGELGDGEEVRRKYHEIDSITTLDIPGFVGPAMGYEEYAKRVYNLPAYPPEGRLVALDGERWVGFASLQVIPASGNAHNEMTGVLKEYRGRGIALALKLLAIRYARSIGAREITTSNDSLNAPMLAVNRKLGYVPQKGQYRVENKAIFFDNRPG